MCQTPLCPPQELFLKQLIGLDYLSPLCIYNKLKALNCHKSIIITKQNFFGSGIQSVKMGETLYKYLSFAVNLGQSLFKNLFF